MILTRNVTTTRDSASLTGVVSFLAESNIKYRVCQFSQSYTKEELDNEISRLGMGLLEAIPLDVEGQGLTLAIIPSSLDLHVAEFSELLAPRVIRLLTPSEICKRFSLLDHFNIVPPLSGLFGLESFLSPLIDQHHLVGFFVGSRNTLITLEAHEFRRTVGNVSAVPVPTRPKYRAYASPGRKINKRCILGVSLENAEFYTSKLITITNWIRDHFAECIVMLGDFLHRITLQLDSNALEKEALEHSKWLARDFVYSQLSVFTQTESSCRFDFVFCSDVQTRECYPKYYSQLVALFAENVEFQNSFRAFSFEFLRRKPQRRENGDDQVDMSCRYLLEELAVICCLAQDLPCTFVYPGSLTILQEIAEGKHLRVPACLLDVDYVELKLKRRKKT
jgi:tRNA-dependent cyclodipeptide synthase